MDRDAPSRQLEAISSNNASALCFERCKTRFESAFAHTRNITAREWHSMISDLSAERLGFKFKHEAASATSACVA
jgi:hypothetical protein